MPWFIPGFVIQHLFYFSGLMACMADFLLSALHFFKHQTS